jgi:hypothetical protein
VEPLVLRDEDPLDDVVVVVRGGEMASDFVRRSAQNAYDEVGIYAVSVFCALDDSPEALCGTEPFLARYRKVRMSTVGRLRGLGFPLIPTLGRPHYDIVLPDLGAQTLGRLDAAFDDAIDNPGVVGR